MEIPEQRYKNKDLLIENINRQLTRLRLLSLSEELHFFLQKQPDDSISSKEVRHLFDFNEFNYLETSLLPALAIFQL